MEINLARFAGKQIVAAQRARMNETERVLSRAGMSATRQFYYGTDAHMHTGCGEASKHASTSEPQFVGDASTDALPFTSQHQFADFGISPASSARVEDR